VSAKDEQYMHEIDRLEGERDYWRSAHAKTDAECVRLRAKLDELLAELEIPCPCLSDNALGVTGPRR
jgi:predicted nuclease with TOPRIM domain